MEKDQKDYLDHLGYVVIDTVGSGTFCRCYHIVGQDVDYIAKTINPQSPPIENSDYTHHPVKFVQKVEHLLNEQKMLRHAQGIAGVPQLIHAHNRLDSRYTALANFFKGEGLCRDQDIALIKEYISGEKMGEGQMLIDPKAQLALEVTVGDLHERGIADLDLKQANILIRDDGLPYLIDFGNATIFNDTSTPLFKMVARNDRDDMRKVIRYG